MAVGGLVLAQLRADASLDASVQLECVTRVRSDSHSSAVLGSLDRRRSSPPVDQLGNDERLSQLVVLERSARGVARGVMAGEAVGVHRARGSQR